MTSSTSTPRPPSPPSERVVQALGTRELRVGPRDQWFFPEPELYQVFDERTVTELYKEIVELYDRKDVYWYLELQNLDPAIIFAEYRKIFALLILTGYGNRIVKFCHYHKLEPHMRFNDRRLPLDTDLLNEVDSTLENSPFLAEQYRFLARVFDNQVNYLTWSGKSILPFLSSEKLQDGNGGFAHVFRTEIHPHYDKLDSPWKGSKNHKHVYARKELIVANNNEEAIQQEREFQLEVNALCLLQGKKHRSILPLLASYKHDDRYNMIFPMADCNLKHYLEMEEKPVIGLERVGFISEISMLAFGLKNIHTTNNVGLALLGKDGHRLASRHFGSHRDLKPTNILCHEFSFMIADFGLSRFHDQEDMSTEGDFLHGVSTYRAPECQKLIAGRAGDIWSLGCIYAEVVAFLVRGSTGTKDLSKEREESVPGLNDNFRRDWFHHEGEVKPKVVEFLDNMVMESQDPVIEDMVALIKKMLTGNKDRRPKIGEVVETFSRIICKEAQRHGAESRVPKEVRRYIEACEVDRSGGRPHLEVTSGESGSRSCTPKLLDQGKRIALPRQSAAPRESRHKEMIVDTPTVHENSGNNCVDGTRPQQSPTATSLIAFENLPTFLQPHAPEQTLRASRSNASLAPDIYTPQTASSNVSIGDRPSSEFYRAVEDSPDALAETPSPLADSPLTPKGRDRGYSIMRSPLVALDYMDTMFLIDNSVHMKGCWDKVQKSLSTFAAVATEHDSDGIEVALMYSAKEVLYSGITDEPTAMGVFKDLTLSEPTWGFSERLEGIIADYIKRLNAANAEGRTLKPLNIIVLTNGTVSKYDSFESTVLSWARALDRDHQPQSQLGIQFVLIGKDIDPGLLHRFNDLDETAHERSGVRDIVDATPYDPDLDADDEFSLFKVMCGGMNRTLDRMKKDPNARLVTVTDEHGIPTEWSISQRSGSIPCPQPLGTAGGYPMPRSLPEGRFYGSPNITSNEFSNEDQYLQFRPSDEFSERSHSVRADTPSLSEEFLEWTPLLLSFNVGDGNHTQHPSENLGHNQQSNSTTHRPQEHLRPPRRRTYPPSTLAPPAPPFPMPISPRPTTAAAYPYRHVIEEPSRGYDHVDDRWYRACVVGLLTIIAFFLWEIWRALAQ